MTHDLADPLLARRATGRAALWVAAACLAGGLHAAAGYALLEATSAEPDEDLGAPALEIGIELAAPKREASEQPPGPESDSSAAQTASVQQRVTTQTTEPVQERPVESDDPDRAVTPEAEKPQEPDPVPAAERSEQSSESVAAEASAAPALEEAREAPASTAPTPGIAESASRAKMTWQRLLLAKLNRNKRYPSGGAARAVQMTVSFTIDRTGRLQAVSVLKRSDDPAFDDAAVDMLRRADPLPPPPPLVADDGLTFTLPVAFQARRHR